jgi:hypothetical protein
MVYPSLNLNIHRSGLILKDHSPVDKTPKSGKSMIGRKDVTGSGRHSVI